MFMLAIPILLLVIWVGFAAFLWLISHAGGGDPGPMVSFLRWPIEIFRE